MLGRELPALEERAEDYRELPFVLPLKGTVWHGVLDRVYRVGDRWYLDDYKTDREVRPEAYRLVYPALGLAGEAGELANKVKKVLRDHGGHLSEEAREAILAELGDVLWYVAQVATDLGESLEAVAQANLAKLRSRKERGRLGGDGDDR